MKSLASWAQMMILEQVYVPIATLDKEGTETDYDVARKINM